MAQQPERPGERTETPADASFVPWLWPLAATRMAMEAWLGWLERGPPPMEPRTASALPWTTPNDIALELTTMRLRDFSTAGSGRATLIAAPYALHSALIADFAPGHSLVEALRGEGVERLYLTDWRSATPDMRLLSIDNYLADLNVAVDDIGAPVDLIGLCQGGWLSLIYAARFPHKVRRLVLVGTPVDVSVESELSRSVAAAPPGAFEALVAGGGGVVQGEHLLRLWSRPPEVAEALQQDLSLDAPADRLLLERFDRWYAETLDLPGTFYLEAVAGIFRDNRLATGAWSALGRDIHLDRLQTPVFLLIGAHDEIVPAEQALATAARLGTPRAFIACETAPSGHLGLFIGRRTLTGAWRRVARWLRDDMPGQRLREVAAI
ncbi:MAG: alpha/beta fold hydrolase [Pseudomonadota bacterium]